MKRIFVMIACCVVLLSSCLETSTSTTINADGSGSKVSIIDISKAMKMALQDKQLGEKDKLYVDTIIQLRNHSDTASILNARQKELLRGTVVRFKIDFRELEKLAFTIAIESPFNTLKDLNELNKLVTTKEYDVVFDKAFTIPMFEDNGAGGSTNDNLFGSVFPAFFKCDYTKGKITCEVDSTAFGEVLSQLTAMEFDLNGEMESKMFGGSTFRNVLVLPSAPKSIEGNTWKKGEKDNVLVQEGTLLQLYKEPGNFIYTIKY